MMNRLVLRLESTKFHWICPKVWCFCRSPKPAEAYEPFTSFYDFSVFQWSKPAGLCRDNRPLKWNASWRLKRPCIMVRVTWSCKLYRSWHGGFGTTSIWDEVSKFKFLFPVVRDLFMEIWNMFVKIHSNGLNFSWNRPFHGWSERYSWKNPSIPLGLGVPMPICVKRNLVLPIFCLKYTTLEAQLCQIQDSEQMRLMRWSRIFLEANISRSLGAQGNDSFSHPHRGEIKSFNPNKGYGFVGCEVPDKKTSILMQFPLWEVIGFWS